MSMVGLALRLSAVRALENGNTIAGARIFDSAITPIEKMLSEDPHPFVVISTGSETNSPSGRDVDNGDGEIDLIIEIAMTKIARLPSGDDYVVDIFQSDANLELGIAILRRQIMACLFGCGGGAWGDVFRSFAASISSITAISGGSTKEGVRFAGRQIVISIKAMAEPKIGAIDAGTVWQKFIQAAEGDATLSCIAPVIRTAIEAKPLDWPATYTAGAVLAGYTEAEAEAIGIAGNHPLTEAQLDPDGWVANAQTVAEQLPQEAT